MLKSNDAVTAENILLSKAITTHSIVTEFPTEKRSIVRRLRHEKNTLRKLTVTMLLSFTQGITKGFMQEAKPEV